MKRLKTALQDHLTELYHTLGFALPVKDYETLTATYNTITDLTSQTSLPDLPYKLFQLTYSPDPFTRILASGALSIHYELDKQHPVHDLIQALDTAARSYEGDPCQIHSYIASLVDSPDLTTLIQQLDTELPSLPSPMRFALTTVVVKCAPDLT